MASGALLRSLLALSLLLTLSHAIVIDVYRNGERVMRYEDKSAESEGRAANLPNSPLRGQMYYAVPRNACQTVDGANETSYNWIALVDNYFDCPSRVAWNLYDAGYGMMLAYSPTRDVALYSTPPLPRVIFTHYSLLEFLGNNTIMGISPNASEYTVKVSLTSWAFYERLFMIFGGVLLAAVSLSIVIFCGSICCRAVFQRWRTRGLSRWRVRQLPKRKYKKEREVCESCSICLDDFKAGENIRVLPCDHIFHPSCVDEWLQKWNRTCPLCKSTIQRRKRGRAVGVANRQSAAPSNSNSDQEHVRLLAHEEGSETSTSGSPTDARDAESYGATGQLDTPLAVPREVVLEEEGGEREGGLSVSVTLEVAQGERSNLVEKEGSGECVTATATLEEQA